MSRPPGPREGNLSLVLRTALAAPPERALSRAGVAATTRLTRSTVSRMVDALVAADLLCEAEPPDPSGRGRPGRPLVAGEGVAALGAQVDAGHLAVRVLDLGGRVLAARRTDGAVAGREPAEVLGELSDLARDVLGELPAHVRVVGAGVALPGLVSTREGRLVLAPNLGWHDLDVAAALDLGPVPSLAVANEATLAAVAAAHAAPGRHRGPRDFVHLSGDVGVGGAVVVHGRVVEGAHGWSGEVGHLCVDPHGPACSCGSTGCLERYVGTPALAEAAGLPTTAGAEDLLTRHAAGDPAAVEAVERAAWALGVALASTVNLLDVHTVVLGGRLGRLCEALRPTLQATLDARVLSARWVRPEVLAAPDDDAPGATGAALRCLDQVLQRPDRWTDLTAAGA